MRWIKYPALAGFVVLSSGCVTNLAPPLKNDAAPTIQNGVIAVSVTSTSDYGIAFILHNTTTGAEYALSMADKPNKSQVTFQNVIATEVPPGEYKINQWETFMNVGKQVLKKDNITNPYIAAPFTVHAGQVTFLGDYYVHSSETGNYRSYTLHWNVAPEKITFDNAHTLFVAAYPAYAKTEFTCRMCDEMIHGYTTNIKDVEADPQAYLGTQFSPRVMAPQVTQMITAADNEPLHFKRIVLHLTWHFNVNNPAKASTTDEVRTLTNAGGPFVQELLENDRNGIPMVQVYGLTYRGLLDMRKQSLNLSKEFATQPGEVKSLEHFDPISAVDSGMNFAYHFGPSSQTTTLSAASVRCVSDGREPASTLDPSLTGDAIKVVCSNYSENNVMKSQLSSLYLPQYGVAVPVGGTSPQGRTEVKLTAITVE
jgi:hypothetical protein